MQVDDRVPGGRAPFDEVQVCTGFQDDQGVFELARTLSIEPEIGLQGNADLHPLGDMHKRASGPQCAMQGGKGMV